MTRLTWGGALLLLLLCLAAPLRAADPVEVEVTGVGGDALKNVRQAVALPYGLVRDQTVDRFWLEHFARQAEEKARVSLEPFGYYNARVAATVTQTGKEQYLLRVAVTPGKPVRVAQLDLSLTGAGAREPLLNELISQFPLEKGDILLQQEYEKAKSRLRSRAQELGYLDADFSRHALHIAPQSLTARIELTLETGGRYFFDEVTIEGAPDYPQQYLRRFLAFKPGEVFSFAKLGETQLNISNSERFRGVTVTPLKQEARDFRVPVAIKLKPVPRRSLRPGIGFGTDTGARFTVRFRDLNLFKKGNDLDVTLYAAQYLQGLAARYTIPSASDLKSSTTLQLNLQHEDVTSYTSSLVALELARNRSFGRGGLWTAYLKVQQEDFTIGTEASGSRLVLPGIRFSLDHFDNLIRPTRGYRIGMDLRGAHPFLGSDSGLLQLIADTNALLPLPQRLTLHLRGKLGGTLLSDPLQDIPPSIRFFAGGSQSVRGYSYQSLGPRDANGDVVGGRDLLVFSAELERALFDNWGISAFYDVGNAFNDFTNLELFEGAGIGLHYYTPVGGLNLSLARRINQPKTSYYVHFTVGFQL